LLLLLSKLHQLLLLGKDLPLLVDYEGLVPHVLPVEELRVFGLGTILAGA